jgi:hypothetical protein
MLLPRLSVKNDGRPMAHPNHVRRDGLPGGEACDVASAAGNCMAISAGPQPGLRSGPSAVPIGMMHRSKHDLSRLLSRAVMGSTRLPM